MNSKFIFLPIAFNALIIYSLFHDYSFSSPVVSNENEYIKFGPLNINLKSFLYKKGKYIVQASNSNQQTIYIAISCIKEKINVTSGKSDWKGWIKPDFDFEYKLLDYVCVTGNIKYITVQ